MASYKRKLLATYKFQKDSEWVNPFTSEKTEKSMLYFASRSPTDFLKVLYFFPWFVMPFLRTFHTRLAQNSPVVVTS